MGNVATAISHDHILTNKVSIPMHTNTPASPSETDAQTDHSYSDTPSSLSNDDCSPSRSQASDDDSPTSSITSGEHSMKQAVNMAVENVAGDPTRHINVMSSAALTKKQQAIVAAAAVDMEQLRDAVGFARASPETAFLSLDVEKDEASSAILEIGITLYLPSRPTITLASCHFVLTEHKNKKNVFCVNDREAFGYGETTEITIARLHNWWNTVTRHLRSLQDNGGYVCLVGHTILSDIRWLHTIGVTFVGIPTIDIANVEKFATGTHQATGLYQLAARYGVQPAGPAHNAGNDAAVTMRTCIMQANTHLNAKFRLPIHNSTGEEG